MTELKQKIRVCGSRFGNWVSEKYFPEFKELAKLAWPIILMNLFRFLNPTISVIMCGHLRKTEFDAASLANVLIQVFGTSIDLGFSTACDTLFAQIYGSPNRKRLGLMLQRAIIVMTITYLILACFHLNIEPILILLSQDVEISRMAATYVTLYLPGLFFDFHFMTFSRYLQSQNIVYPMMFSSGIACLYNIVVQYIAIYVLGFGINASAVIQAFGCFLMFMIQLIYIRVSKVYQQTWQGIEFSNALQGWESFFKLGLPGIVMIGIEEWTFEVGSFLAGAINDVQLGGQSIAIQIGFLCYMIHSGLSIAVSIRIGQFLGANEPHKASLSAKTNMITDYIAAIITATMLFSLRHYLPYIFTNDKEIREVAENILLLVGILQFLDATGSSACSVIRACGKQLLGAIIMFLSYYAIGVPIGIVLIFVVAPDIRGFWIGLLIALAIEVAIYMFIFITVNWEKEALKAAMRIKEAKIVEYQNDNMTIDDITEKTNLICASEDPDDEDNQKHPNPVLIFQPGHRRPTSSVTDIIISKSIHEEDLVLNKKIDRSTILKRAILIGITLFLFISSILIKIYLPRKLYIPCIPIHGNGTKLSLNKHYPFCNDTMYTM